MMRSTQEARQYRPPASDEGDKRTLELAVRRSSDRVQPRSARPVPRLVPRKIGAAGHTPGGRPGYVDPKFELLPDPHGLGRRLGRYTESADSPQKLGRSALHGHRFD